MKTRSELIAEHGGIGAAAAAWRKANGGKTMPIACPKCGDNVGLGYRTTVAGGSRTRIVAKDRTARGVICKACAS